MSGKEVGTLKLLVRPYFISSICSSVLHPSVPPFVLPSSTVRISCPLSMNLAIDQSVYLFIGLSSSMSCKKNARQSIFRIIRPSVHFIRPYIRTCFLPYICPSRRLLTRPSLPPPLVDIYRRLRPHVGFLYHYFHQSFSNLFSLFPDQRL